MQEVKAQIIYETVKQLCLIANTILPQKTYKKLLALHEEETSIPAKNVLAQILQNAWLAKHNKRPLCQDTGFVTVFFKIGQKVHVVGDNIDNTINKAVKDAYQEFFFRKSIVEDPLFERKNTTTNTPVLIHTEIVNGDNIEIIVSTKGGGCENASMTRMLTPSDGISGVKNFVLDTISKIGAKSCPPLKIGIGIGSNAEGSILLSKKALLGYNNNNAKYNKLAEELLEEINSLNIGAMGLGGKSTCFSLNILSAPCHIATLPVSISFSCHSCRHASAIIKGEEIQYMDADYCINSIQNTKAEGIVIHTNEVEKIRNLKEGTSILLSGKIYTARDAAHQKFAELITQSKEIPFNIKDAIIFYAGPCPATNAEIIGPIGPTTSARMDKYTKELYEMGLLATIGKGERSPEIINTIQNTKGKYFIITGGVASLLQKCVKSAKLIAYEELGAEAVYELEVSDLPMIVKY